MKLIMLAVIAGVGLLVVMSVPDIKRYIEMKGM